MDGLGSTGPISMNGNTRHEDHCGDLTKRGGGGRQTTSGITPWAHFKLKNTKIEKHTMTSPQPPSQLAFSFFLSCCSPFTSLCVHVFFSPSNLLHAPFGIQFFLFTCFFFSSFLEKKIPFCELILLIFFFLLFRFGVRGASGAGASAMTRWVPRTSTRLRLHPLLPQSAHFHHRTECPTWSCQSSSPLSSLPPLHPSCCVFSLLPFSPTAAALLFASFSFA